MSTLLTFKYLAYDGSAWSVDLGTSAIRLGRIPGFSELALLGAVGRTTVVVDDTAGTAGHSSDGFLPYQRFRVDDTRASVSRIAELWTGTQMTSRRRASSPTDSLRTGPMREIELTLEDANTLAGRRPIPPKSVDSTVNRPAESPSARIAWLLSTAYFSSTVADNGHVHPAGGTLDATDYSDQHPADVLNDCSTLTGDNWFIYWDRTNNAWSLAVFNMTTYDGFTSTLRLSNDTAQIDSNLTGTWAAGANNCWAIEKGAELIRDWSDYANVLDYAYAKGVVERTSTHTGYPVVGRTASSTTVKSPSIAQAKADRMLAENATPHDRIICRAKIGVAHVNDAFAGQLIQASFLEFPDYTSLSDFRITRRTPGQIDESDEFYSVEFELVPAAPVTATATFAVVDRGYVASSGAVDTPGIGSYEMGYSGTGDSPPASSDYPSQPKTGLIDYYLGGAGGVIPIGFTVSGSGTLTAVAQVKPELGYNGTGMTVEMRVLVNGVQAASSGVYTDPSGGGPHTIDPDLSISASISVSSGDHLTTSFIIAGHASEIGTVPIAGIFAPPYQFSVTGNLT